MKHVRLSVTQHQRLNSLSEFREILHGCCSRTNLSSERFVKLCAVKSTLLFGCVHDMSPSFLYFPSDLDVSFGRDARKYFIKDDFHENRCSEAMLGSEMYKNSDQ